MSFRGNVSAEALPDRGSAGRAWDSCRHSPLPREVAGPAYGDYWRRHGQSATTNPEVSSSSRALIRVGANQSAEISVRNACKEAVVAKVELTYAQTGDTVTESYPLAPGRGAVVEAERPGWVRVDVGLDPAVNHQDQCPGGAGGLLPSARLVGQMDETESYICFPSGGRRVCYGHFAVDPPRDDSTSPVP